LERRSFASLEEQQAALDRYLTYYNTYRLHSALQWQPAVTRYSSRSVLCGGVAGLPGLEAMAANPAGGESYCDPPIVVSPPPRSKRTRSWCGNRARKRWRLDRHALC